MKKTIIESLQNITPLPIDLPTNQYAVLLPIIEIENELHILFEVRAKNLKRQPNEVCFPGGKVEQNDTSTQFTAIRETCEELGIDQSNINDIFPINYYQSDIQIYPYVGFLQNTNFHLNKDVVDKIFTVPLQKLLTISPTIHRVNLIPQVSDNFPYHLIPNGQNYKWQTRHIDEYFYCYEDKVIWGLTARILQHFLELIK